MDFENEEEDDDGKPYGDFNTNAKVSGIGSTMDTGSAIRKKSISNIRYPTCIIFWQAVEATRYFPLFTYRLLIII